MSSCVEKLPHTCGTSDALQVFQEDEGRYSGYCFRCQTYVPDPYSDKPEGYIPPKPAIPTDEEIAERLSEISSYPTVDVPRRKLKREYLEYFGVKTGLDSERAEEPVILCFPYYKDHDLKGYKVKTQSKKMWAIPSIKGSDPFGWQQAIHSGAARLLVTEGEEDAIALFQVLKESNKGTEFEGYNPAVISLSNGAGDAVKEIGGIAAEISKKFREVCLVFDQDEAGRAAAKKLSRAGDYLVAELPEKDANECLIRGRSKALKSAVMFKANKPKNTSIIYGSSLKNQARKRPEWGLCWPWQKLTEATRGIRRGETIYVGAGVKMGKSSLVKAVATHLIVNHDLPVFMCCPEEPVVKTYQMLVGQAAGRIFHDPKIEFDEDAYDKFEPLIGDRAMIQDVYQFVDWDTLKYDIKYAVNDGVKDVIIDPITCFTNQVSSAEANEMLQAIAAELAAMAKDLDFTAYTFCHLKAPLAGPSHERGGEVHSTQFAGSRAMMRACNYMIGMEGNKDPELPLEQKNLRTLVILEDREFGVSERIPLYWDYRTGLFKEVSV